LATRYECTEITTIVGRRRFGVVGWWRRGIERIEESAMQTVGLTVAGISLANVVEIVPECLICDEQPQKAQVSPARQHGEQRSAVGVIVLEGNGLECVRAQSGIRNRPR
jgi:hypothetical protein